MPPTLTETAAAEQGSVSQHVLLPTRLACHLILQQGRFCQSYWGMHAVTSVGLPAPLSHAGYAIKRVSACMPCQTEI